jgi:hypothetical protein
MTDITVTLGNRPILDAEEQRARALRAQEVLAGAGWLFDEVISSAARDLLDTQPNEAHKREEAYQLAYAAALLKQHLNNILREKAAEEKKNERRSRNEPPAHHE